MKSNKCFLILLLDEDGVDDINRLNNNAALSNFFYTPNIDEQSAIGQRSIVMVEGNQNNGNKMSPWSKYDRPFENNYYCPVHALQNTIIREPLQVDRDTSVPLISLPMRDEMVQVCSCQLMKKQHQP